MPQQAQDMVQLIQDFGWEFLIGTLALIAIGILLILSEKSGSKSRGKKDEGDDVQL